MDPDKQGAQTGQHRWTQQPFPSRILPGSQREGCYNYCYHGMEKWVCDSSDERLLTIALLFSCWLLGSSPSLVQGSHLPALPQAICTNIPFLLASPSHTSQHLTTLPCYMVQPWPHTQAAQFSITDITWVQQDRSSCFSFSSSPLLLQALCHLPGTPSHQRSGIGTPRTPWSVSA